MSDNLGMGGAGALEAYANYASGRAQQQAHAMNARVAAQQAKDARAAGAFGASQVRRQREQVIGSQRAAGAAAGVDIETGTMLQLAEETAALAEQDIVTIQNNTAREAWGYQQKARTERYLGASALAGGKLDAATSLLSAGARIWGK